MDKSASKLNNLECVAKLASKPIKRESVIKKTLTVENLSKQLKSEIIQSIESGRCSRSDAAIKFNIPYYTVRKIYNQFLQTGIVKDVDCLPNISKLLNKEQVKFLFDKLSENCKYKVSELQEMLISKYKLEISTTTIASAIKTKFHYNLMRVEKDVSLAVTQARLNSREKYCELYMRLKKEKRFLIYVDESEFQITIRRQSKRTSEPLNEMTEKTPKTKTKIVMAAMTGTELLFYKAFYDVWSPDCLRLYLTDLFTILTDRDISGAAIIIDRFMTHYCHGISKATETAGHELIFLPENNSDLHPVAGLLSNWVETVRAQNPTNEKELEEITDHFKGVVNEQQCQIYVDRAMENVTTVLSKKYITSMT